MNRSLMVLCAVGVFIALHAPAASDHNEPWVRHIVTENFVNFAASAADFTGDGLIDVISSGG